MLFIIDRIYGRLGNSIIRFAALSTLLNNYPYEIQEIEINGKILPLKYKNKMLEYDKTKYKIILIDNMQEFNTDILLLKDTIINITGWYQRFSYFNNEYIRNHIRDAFYTLQPFNKREEIIIHIRSGDQWLYNKPNKDPVHPCQHVIPIKFYKKILENNTLPVRFVCESLDDKFIREIQKVFPNAVFQSTNELNDFITLLSAKKLVLSVSTFSWCAGWLNNVADEIIVPLHGFFHPLCNRYLLPDDREHTEFMINEDRYKYIFVESPETKLTKWYGNENDYEYCIKVL
jgi:hypothetical protein